MQSGVNIPKRQAAILVGRWLLIVAALLVPGAAQARGTDAAVDAELKPYEKLPNLAGNLNSIGSDTLNNLMTLWAETFQKQYPNVHLQIKGEGSATAPPALIDGTAQLGPMSREMQDAEIEAFEKKYGFQPTRVSVALDCLAVYVHKDNPLRGLTLQQLDCIFSQTRKSGYRGIFVWGEVGLSGTWEKLPVSAYGRNAVSGTHLFFQEHVLLKSDFKETVKEQPGSAAVVSSVASDPGAIGYSGIGYKTPEVRALFLAKDAQSPLVEPTFENALAGKYPLGRTLYIYVAKKPNTPLPPPIKEFLKFALSKQGQELVIKDGLGALPAKTIESQLKQIE
jgi:phosphate transport system substrate-binding protein